MLGGGEGAVGGVELIFGRSRIGCLDSFNPTSGPPRVANFIYQLTHTHTHTHTQREKYSLLYTYMYNTLIFLIIQQLAREKKEENIFILKITLKYKDLSFNTSATLRLEYVSLSFKPICKISLISYCFFLHTD